MKWLLGRKVLITLQPYSKLKSMCNDNVYKENKGNRMVQTKERWVVPDEGWV